MAGRCTFDRMVRALHFSRMRIANANKACAVLFIAAACVTVFAWQSEFVPSYRTAALFNFVVPLLAILSGMGLVINAIWFRGGATAVAFTDSGLIVSAGRRRGTYGWLDLAPVRLAPLLDPNSNWLMIYASNRRSPEKLGKQIFAYPVTDFAQTALAVANWVEAANLARAQIVARYAALGSAG